MKEMLKGSKGRAGLPEDVKIIDYPKCSYVNEEMEDQEYSRNKKNKGSRMI